MTHFLGRIAGPGLLALLRFVAWLVGEGPLSQPFVMLVCRLVRRTRLFDEEWYQLVNPDVVNSGMDSIRHFVLYGDREGRWPMRLFDPSHYRAHAPSPCPKLLNSLLHYAYSGRYKGATTSTWFDAGWYLNVHRDVKFSRMDPLRHFVSYGWAEGRKPSEAFDPEQFLRAMSKRGDSLADSPFGKGLEHDAPSAVDWEDITPARYEGPVAVDVVVPVFRGYTETLRCIYAVLSQRQRTAFELIVINDGCHDARLHGALEGLAQRGLFRYHVNESSHGFVATANRGMRIHPGRDVVLLTADVEVFGGWLDRLRDCAYRSQRVASVTPLSNNGGVCSYPRFNQDNPQILEVRAKEIDEIAARVNAKVSVAVPAGVGSCMYIRRAAIDAVGVFEDKAFLSGYGGEVEFCQRAVAAGWQNLVAADVYVWRWSGIFFDYVRRRRAHRLNSLLQAGSPGYQESLAAFVAADPLHAARQAIDMARLDKLLRRENVLVVTHRRGGGTERHVKSICGTLRAAGQGVVILRALKSGATRLEAVDAGVLPNLPEPDCRSPEALAALCCRLRISAIQIHQLVDFPRVAIEAFSALSDFLPAVPVELHVHDYFSICPRINLIDARRVYCGEPEVAQCNACLRRPQPNTYRVEEIGHWRARMRLLHENAAAVVVPDADVSTRLRKYFPAARFSVRPLEEAMPAPVRWKPRKPRTAPVHVVVIGAIVGAKGFTVLNACALDARNRRLPLQFTLMGYSQDNSALRKAGVHVTGLYEEEDAAAVLAGLRADVAWLPSVWPETYSYTLSVALAGGMPVAAFDLGAIAARLREGDHDALLMPLAWHARPELINAAFIRMGETSPFLPARSSR